MTITVTRYEFSNKKTPRGMTVSVRYESGRIRTKRFRDTCLSSSTWSAKNWIAAEIAMTVECLDIDCKTSRTLEFYVDGKLVKAKTVLKSK